MLGDIPGPVTAGTFDPTRIIPQQETPTHAIEADETFDRREEGRLKTELLVAAA